MPEELNGAAPAAPEGNVIASTPETVAPQTPTQEAPKSIEDTMAAVFDKANPQTRVDRAPDGKFESKAEADEAADESTPGQAPNEAVVEPPKAAIAAPNSLPAELRDKFAAVPPEVAEWIGKREAEAHKRITELGETAKAGESVRAVIDRYRETFRGVPVEQGLEKLLAANAFLERSPADGIKWLAEAYGVDLSAYAAKPSDEQPESGEVRALKAEIQSLKQAITDTRNRVQTREQREESERTASLAKLVEDFAKDKTYWTEIEEDVLGQIQAVRAREPNLPPEKILQKAHDQALKVNEAVSNKLKEAERKAAAEKEEAEKKRKADEAKKHASLNVKSTGNVSTKPKGSWEETMREVGNRLMA